jgi:C4-dicarboxylate transporter, DctQ subunit
MSAQGDEATPPPGRGALLAAIDRVLGAVSWGAAAAGAVVVIAMTAIVGYSVAARYLFNNPQVWTDETVGYLLVLLVMLGAAEALRRGEHIGVDLLTERLGAVGRRRAEMWSVAAVIAFAAALAFGGWEVAAFSRSVDLYSEGYLEIPMWIPQAAVPLGAVLLVVVAANRLVRLVVGLDKPFR